MRCETHLDACGLDRKTMLEWYRRYNDMIGI